MDFNEYDDYYVPSDIELAYNQFLEKVETCATKGIKAQISQIKEDKKHNEEQLMSLRNYERQLNDRQAQLTKNEKYLDERKDAIVAEWLRKYGLDLKPGQTVWVIQDEPVKHRCLNCQGTGKLFIEKDGLHYETRCPDCFYGNVSLHHYSIVETKVSEVMFKFGYDKAIGQERVYRDTYALDVTGIELATSLVSGRRTYSRDEIFTSYKDAEKKLKGLTDGQDNTKS